MTSLGRAVEAWIDRMYFCDRSDVDHSPPRLKLVCANPVDTA